MRRWCEKVGAKLKCEGSTLNFHSSMCPGFPFMKAFIADLMAEPLRRD